MASASFQLAGPLLGHKLDHDLVRGRWYLMTISSQDAENVCSQVWPKSQDFVDRPLNVLLLD